jgi:hypothetical protein
LKGCGRGLMKCKRFSFDFFLTSVIALIELLLQV